MKYLRLFIYSQVMVLTAALVAGEPQKELKLSLSWGRQSEDVTPFYISFLAEELEIADISGQEPETADQFREGALVTYAGGHDVDGVVLTLRYPETPVRTTDNLQSIWAYLLEHSDDDTARRLRLDPAYRQDSRKLIVRMDSDGTKGFSLTIDQLLGNSSFRVPSLDIYLAAGDLPLSFADHLKELDSWKGKRILAQVHKEPEATYQQYTTRWKDMASPDYVNPHQPFPGHIVCLSWDSAIYKFGLDRGAGIWNDLGNPDKFRFWFDFGDLSHSITKSWKSQKLADGLPVISTIFEKDGLRYEVEQFAYPLNGPPTERRGDIPMVLLQKVKVTNLKESAREISILTSHQRQLEVSDKTKITPLADSDAFLFEDSASGNILFSIEGTGPGLRISSKPDSGKKADEKKNTKSTTSQIVISLDIGGNDSQEFIVKLPSPIVSPEDREKLLALEYVKARSETLKFWSDYVKRGAQFKVPEKAVNDLFRANLWHALRLPRRHGGLDYSCYYHIRDYHVSFERFAPFMSAKGTAFMTGWWNRMPQFDGLFDFQNNVRPAYFTFKLLSRLTGEQLRLTSESPTVHGFMTRDERYSSYEYNLLLWNFSASPIQVELSFENMPGNMTAKPVVLDAATTSNDEIARLRPESSFQLKADQPSFRISFEPYGVRFWSFERRN